MRISDWSSDVCSSDLCAACHSIDLVHFRDLEGIGYNKAEVKAIAAQWVIEQPTINPDTGEASTRKNLPSDPLPKPFAHDVAARAANNNALPPDLSLMVKAREDGAADIHWQIGRAHVCTPVTNVHRVCRL